MTPGKCMSCGRAIYWVEMKSGKKAPVEYPGESRVWCRPDGTDARVVTVFNSHESNCPSADKHRKGK